MTPHFISPALFGGAAACLALGLFSIQVASQFKWKNGLNSAIPLGWLQSEFSFHSNSIDPIELPLIEEKKILKTAPKISRARKGVLKRARNPIILPSRARAIEMDVSSEFVKEETLSVSDEMLEMRGIRAALKGRFLASLDQRQNSDSVVVYSAKPLAVPFEAFWETDVAESLSALGPKIRADLGQLAARPPKSKKIRSKVSAKLPTPTATIAKAQSDRGEYSENSSVSLDTHLAKPETQSPESLLETKSNPAPVQPDFVESVKAIAPKVEPEKREELAKAVWDYLNVKDAQDTKGFGDKITIKPVQASSRQGIQTKPDQVVENGSPDQSNKTANGFLPQENSYCPGSFGEPSHLDSQTSIAFLSAIEGLDTRVVAAEPSFDLERSWAWIVTQNAGYLPTITLASTPSKVSDEGKRDFGVVPRLSQSNYAFMAWANKRKTVEGMGIVLVRAAKESCVRLSRYEAAPIVIENSKKSLERYFLFPNVKPGSVIVSAAESSLALPVVANQMSYLDLTDLKNIQMKVEIVNADSSSMTPIVGAELELNGSAMKLETEIDGAVLIRGIQMPPGHSVFVDTNCGGASYRSRYKLKPVYEGQTKAVQRIFCVSKSKINQMIKETSVKPSAGASLLFAGLSPQIVGQSQSGVFATLRDLSATAISARTFSIQKSGKLEEYAPVEKASPRLISLNVNDGPAVLSLEDQRLQRVWSGLFHFSPRVVCMVGP